MKNTTIKDIRKMSETYGVNIHLFFGKDRYGALLYNKHEEHRIMIGFDENMVEEIKSKCIEMNNNSIERNKRVDERLNKLAEDERINKTQKALDSLMERYCSGDMKGKKLAVVKEIKKITGWYLVVAKKYFDDQQKPRLLRGWGVKHYDYLNEERKKEHQKSKL